MTAMMKKRFMVFPAMLILLMTISSPAQGVQTFTLADFAGDWYWFVLGGYDEYAETADAKFTLTGNGTMIPGGQGTFNNYPATYLTANLTISQEGYVGGTLECDQVIWHIVRASMDGLKTEVTGTARGYKDAVIFRMVRVSGEPAEMPGAPGEE